MIIINIRPFMKKHGLDVQQLAERANISLNTARSYYFGVPTRVDLPILDAICKVLEVGPGDVLVQTTEDDIIEDIKRREMVAI
jgi:DNA-binding Xre family transcriptional regulator